MLVQMQLGPWRRARMRRVRRRQSRGQTSSRGLFGIPSWSFSPARVLSRLIRATLVGFCSLNSPSVPVAERRFAKRSHATVAQAGHEETRRSIEVASIFEPRHGPLASHPGQGRPRPAAAAAIPYAIFSRRHREHAPAFFVGWGVPPGQDMRKADRLRNPSCPRSRRIDRPQSGSAERPPRGLRRYPRKEWRFRP